MSDDLRIGRIVNLNGQHDLRSLPENEKLNVRTLAMWNEDFLREVERRAGDSPSNMIAWLDGFGNKNSLAERWLRRILGQEVRP